MVVVQAPLRPHHHQIVRSETELAADVPEIAYELLRVDAEPGEQTAVVVGVDLVGQLALGLRDLVTATAGLQQLQDLFLGNLHDVTGPTGHGRHRRGR